MGGRAVPAGPSRATASRHGGHFPGAEANRLPASVVSSCLVPGVSLMDSEPGLVEPRAPVLADRPTAGPDRADAAAAEAAESCLRRKGYLALRAVACECRGGGLPLRGRLP